MDGTPSEGASGNDGRLTVARKGAEGGGGRGCLFFMVSHPFVRGVLCVLLLYLFSMAEHVCVHEKRARRKRLVKSRRGQHLQEMHELGEGA